MKKITKHFRAIIAMAIMLCVALPTFAHDFEVGGIYYRYLDKTAKTVVVSYKGNYSDSYSNEYTGSVTIPSSVSYSGTKYLVTSIDNFAFDGCTGLTSVTIPNSFTSIGWRTFKDCTGLTSVTIPNSVTLIGDNAFDGCTGLTSVTIPNSVTTIGSSAFDGCTGLTEVTIPNSVTTIGGSAFMGCTGLTEVTIPNSVTSIGSAAFGFCNRLTSATILATTPPTVYKNSFPPSTMIYTSNSVVDLYKSTSPWNWFRLGCMFDNINDDTETSGAISFSGSGSGTESDPYLIFNPIQLNDMRNSVGHSGVYYKLMNDIDMREWIAENNPTQGWQPIGNETSKFKGVFLGNGKKITGITISRETTDYIGLFGYLYNATVSNLIVEGNITGGNYVGGITGKSYNSSIINSSFNGNVIGNGDYTGGIVGSSLNDIYKNCSFLEILKQNILLEDLQVDLIHQMQIIVW